MTFLGKVYLEDGGLRFGAGPDGTLAMLKLGATDPAGIFLAYDVGGGWFSLQAHTGQWVYLNAEQSPIAWYPVLSSARLGPPTRFSMQYFDAVNRRVKLAFLWGMMAAESRAADAAADDGKVALYRTSGTNPYCSCEFDAGNGWGYGLWFRMGTLAPGVPELERTKNGVGADFACLGRACVDLSGASFSSVDFRNATFAGANLRSAKFTECTLTATRLVGANLAATDFSGSSVAGTDFSGADLTVGTLLPEPPLASDPAYRTLFRSAKVPAASLRKNWSYLDLTGATLTGADTADLRELVARHMLAPDLVLAGRSLPGADFGFSDLSGAHFQAADLTSAKLRSATLRECLFSRAKLGGACFDPDPSSPTPVATDLTGAKFSSAHLAKASLKSAVMWKAVLTSADLSEADLTSAQLGGVDRSAAASLSYAYLANTKLDRANLFGVNFAYVTLFGASASMTQTATMELADFSNAYLAGIDLSDADLRGAKFSGACLVNVRLNNTVLLPAAAGSVTASLAGASLQGTDFTGAQLDAADLTNAAVAFGNGEVPVRYCDQYHELFPSPPGSMPLRHGPTKGLDVSAMGPDTRCPNGYTLAENQAHGRTLQEMLTSRTAPTFWSPSGCGPPAPAKRVAPETGSAAAEGDPCRVVGGNFTPETAASPAPKARTTGAAGSDSGRASPTPASRDARRGSG